MVLRLLQVWWGMVLCHLVIFIGVDVIDGLCVWVQSVREDVCFPAYILEVFQIFGSSKGV